MALDPKTISDILAQTHPGAKIALPDPIETDDDGIEMSDAVTPDLLELRKRYLPDSVLAADGDDDSVLADDDPSSYPEGPEQTWVEVEIGDAEPKSMLIDDETQTIILEQG